MAYSAECGLETVEVKLVSAFRLKRCSAERTALRHHITCDLVQAMSPNTLSLAVGSYLLRGGQGRPCQ